MAKALTKQQYADLVEKIAGVYTKANSAAKQAVSTILTKAYWQIGKYIIEVEQGSQSRAQYGDKLLEGLSVELTQRLGSGFSLTNLKCMRQFFVTHPSIGQTSDQLGWSQHTKLLTVKDDKKRQDLEKRCIKNNWKVRDLARVIKEEKIQTEEFDSGAGAASTGSKAGGTLKLRAPRGILGLFKIAEFEGLHIPKGMKALDMGFNTFTTGVEGIHKYNDGDIVAVEGPQEAGSKSRLIKSDAKKSDLYTYKAYVERVIDGDTILVDVDCGFGTWARQRLRFKGINTPELKTKRGRMAKRYTERALLSVEFLVIRTHGTDIFDRYLVDVFYLPGEGDPNIVAKEGIHFNQELLESGLASIYVGRG